MADNVQPDAGEQREESSSSGLLLSVDPLQAANNYKLAGDDDSDGSDKGGLLGDDASDSDGSDSDLLGGDDDSSDASDSDGSDKRAGDSDGSDSLLGGDDDSSATSDADASDAADAGSIVPDGDSDEQADEQMNPLGIADTNVDGASTTIDSDGTDAK